MVGSLTSGWLVMAKVKGIEIPDPPKVVDDGEKEKQAVGATKEGQPSA
jgi:hypothetical protein